jgi:hypothetical protein
MALSEGRHSPRKVAKANLRTRTLKIKVSVWRNTNRTGNYCAFASYGAKRVISGHRYDWSKRHSSPGSCGRTPTRAINKAVRTLVMRTK